MALPPARGQGPGLVRARGLGGRSPGNGLLVCAVRDSEFKLGGRGASDRELVGRSEPGPVGHGGDDVTGSGSPVPR